jgi:hypothetical protein
MPASTGTCADLRILGGAAVELTQRRRFVAASRRLRRFQCSAPEDGDEQITRKPISTTRLFGGSKLR